MVLSIAQKQNYIYSGMICLTILMTIFIYRISQNKWIIFRKAENYFHEKNFSQAIPFYRESLNEGVSPNRVFVHLADAYVAEGEFSEAIKWYKEYLKLYPKNAEVRISYAHALNWNGNIQEADEEYQKVIKQHEMDQNL